MRFAVLITLLLLLPWSPQMLPAGREAFIVLSMNCGDGDNVVVDVDAAADILRAGGWPDVVFLQEPKHAEERLREAGGYTSALAPSLGIRYSGPALLTSLPVLDVLEVPCPCDKERSLAALCALLDLGGQTCLACSVHLEHVSEFRRGRDQRVAASLPRLAGLLWSELFEENCRSRCADLVMRVVEQTDADHVVLGGDFNTVPFAGAPRRVGRTLVDALAFRADYFTGTFHKLDFPFKPRIDFIFHSPGLECLDARVLAASPGDHRPVLAVFAQPVRLSGRAAGPSASPSPDSLP